MNNTAMAAILMAATLVVGTFATTTATTVFAASNNSGNTITIQKCKQAAIQSGWDNTQEEECANLICTHPGAGATCVSEGGNKTAGGGGGGGTIDPCLNCFAILSADEQARFITAAVQSFGFNVKSIEDICRIIGTGTITVGQIAAVLQSANIPQSEGTHGALLIKCLLDAGLITNTDTT